MYKQVSQASGLSIDLSEMQDQSVILDIMIMLCRVRCIASGPEYVVESIAAHWVNWLQRSTCTGHNLDERHD